MRLPSTGATLHPKAYPHGSSTHRTIFTPTDRVAALKRAMRSVQPYHTPLVSPSVFSSASHEPRACLVLPRRATPPDRFHRIFSACQSDPTRGHRTPVFRLARGWLPPTQGCRAGDAHPLRIPTFAAPLHPTSATLSGLVGLGSGTPAQTGAGVISWRRHHAWDLPHEPLITSPPETPCPRFGKRTLLAATKGPPS